MIGGDETPKSAARAGRLGLGVLLAILCGHRKDISILSAYTMNRKKARHSPERLKIGFMGHVYLAEITEQAIDEFYPYYSSYRYYVNQQREFGRRMSLDEFQQLSNPESALFVGNPDLVVEKSLHQYELFGHNRLLAQMDIGGLPFEKVARNIELLATEVVPKVK